jgi:chemotaxis protein CheD
MNPVTIHVNIAEIQVANSNSELVCLGLGSCIAVVLYDPLNKIGGLAHVMLPNSRLTENLMHPGKFADTAVKALLKKMHEKGANLKQIHAKIFGGANMFSSVNSSNKATIGQFNTNAVLKELEYYEIPVLAKDVGGHSGRSISFSTRDGLVTMKKIKEGIKKEF